jgi:hypothetical protein
MTLRDEVDRINGTASMLAAMRRMAEEIALVKADIREVIAEHHNLAARVEAFEDRERARGGRPRKDAS